MVRSKRKVCATCRTDDGTLQVSHRYGRRNMAVRWDEENVDLFCDRHHRLWERMTGAERKGWIVAKLGSEGARELERRAVSSRKWTDAEANEMIERFKV